MEKNSTELVFILDESGSMCNLKNDTIGGFNSMIEKQKENKGKCYVSTILFNTNNKVVHDRLDLNNVPLMTNHDYYPSGCTALMDAIGDSVKHIKFVHKYIREEDVPTKTLFVIMTDGMENASTRYNRFDINKMINEQKEKHNWDFIFIGANINAEETAKSYGINPEMAVNYHADAKGSEVVYENICETVTNLRATGKMNTKWKENIEKDYRSRK